MKLNEIKRDGFYTDGKRVFFKSKHDMFSKNNFYVVLTERYEGDRFIHTGVKTAYVSSKDFEIEVKKVEPGEEFQNGDIKIIDAKTLDTLFIDSQISNFQFENGVEPNYKYLRKIRTFADEIAR